MRNLLLLLHIAAAIFWMGGMAFMVLALRPVAAAMLKPPERLPLLVEVMRRFFWVVGISIVFLLLTGGMLMAGAREQMPPGWSAMAAIGVFMMLVFGHIVAGPYRKLRGAVAASNWHEGGSQMGKIALLVKINLGLGWIAIAAVLLWR